jgi:hypothetical protein
MAFTVNAFVLEELPTAGKDWYKSLAIEDLSGAEDVAAAEAGFTHYLTRLTVRADAAMDITIGSGETGGAVTTIHLGPVPLAAGFGFYQWTAPKGKGLKFTAGAAIVADAAYASGTGTIFVEAHGRSCKLPQAS